MEQDKPAKGTIEAMSPALAAVLARDPEAVRAANAQREQREAEWAAQMEALRAARPKVEPETEPERELTIAEQVEAGVRAALGAGDRPKTHAEIHADMVDKAKRMLRTEVDGNGNPIS